MIGLESEPGALDAAARASIYRLLARFLSSVPLQGELELAGALTGDESALGQAVQTFANFAAVADPETAGDDFQRLFIGLGGGELTPYASHYIAGSLHDRPLVQIREDMRRIGLRHSDGVREPEDHAATILEVMGELVEGRIGVGVMSPRDFFERHIRPWMSLFLGDLAAKDNSPLYAALGRLGAEFIDAEARLMTAGVGEDAQRPRFPGDVT